MPRLTTGRIHGDAMSALALSLPSLEPRHPKREFNSVSHRQEFPKSLPTDKRLVDRRSIQLAIDFDVFKAVDEFDVAPRLGGRHSDLLYRVGHVVEVGNLVAQGAHHHDGHQEHAADNTDSGSQWTRQGKTPCCNVDCGNASGSRREGIPVRSSRQVEQQQLGRCFGGHLQRRLIADGCAVAGGQLLVVEAHGAAQHLQPGQAAGVDGVGQRLARG